MMTNFMIVAAESTGLDLGNFSGVLSEVWSQITNCMGTIKGEPLLLLPIGVGFAGSIIGVSKRFLRFGRRR